MVPNEFGGCTVLEEFPGVVARKTLPGKSLPAWMTVAI